MRAMTLSSDLKHCKDRTELNLCGPNVVLLPLLTNNYVNDYTIDLFSMKRVVERFSGPINNVNTSASRTNSTVAGLLPTVEIL